MQKTQKCRICGKRKRLNQFYNAPANKLGVVTRCKECVKEYQKRPERREYDRKYKAENKDRLYADKREWNKKNKEHIQSYERKYKPKRKDHYQRRMAENDVQWRLKRQLRSRLYHAINRNFKTGSAVESLGCTIAELKIHLEAQFEEGMTWDNWGVNGWHIDHIKPLHMFDLTDQKQFREACHYTNLRPLWEIDNLTRTYEEFENEDTGMATE